ncbi:flavoprotein [Desulfosporosinus fructosivorans]|uniref:Flavoprotein n=1 Tax=Desulfosporosinus fructosivorans TaxID=2018669 RepID=A0A4Z0QY29_9FIRM|nr:flavoprotein [Desulfosporosinus fructosivorans]TGE35418.1 flavoprotein [Desulfosporosinus fructosivorans]
MNEELINQLVKRILSEPAFQALLHGSHEGSSAGFKAKPDGIVLLNYVPEFERVITALKHSSGAEYRLSILPSDQAFVAKPELPEGMSWITPQEALEKTTWQKIILPACSLNTLAKAALGIRDNPISELIGRGITQGIPIWLGTEYLGLNAQTPKAYRALYEGYLQTVQTYGVQVSARLGEECILVTKTSQSPRTSLYELQAPSNEQTAPIREEIRFAKKFLGDKEVYGIPEGSLVRLKQGTVISPLARDTMKSRRIELRQEKEEGSV